MKVMHLYLQSPKKTTLLSRCLKTLKITKKYSKYCQAILIFKSNKKPLSGKEWFLFL